jgi:DNA-binding Xre family transcriptional regulator
MILVFRRTGQRRYSVEAQRAGFPNLEMNPAPGYDERMPHDLMHLIVEAQLGLNHGIFGQLAAGGDAGTFHITMKSGDNSRQVARARKRVSTRGKKLMSRGRDDCLESERATFICWQEWLARSSSAKEKKQSAAMAEQAASVRGTASTPALDRKKLDEICRHLDQLSARWSSLKVGESMAVGWPDLSLS